MNGRNNAVANKKRETEKVVSEHTNMYKIYMDDLIERQSESKKKSQD